jgi:hypothetical protein
MGRSASSNVFSIGTGSALPAAGRSSRGEIVLIETLLVRQLPGHPKEYRPTCKTSACSSPGMSYS